MKGLLRRRALAVPLAAAAALACSSPPPATAAAILWYNGNDDGRDSQANKIGTPLIPAARVYDDFIVPAGQRWTITGVFSNDAITASGITSAGWEIRSGVGPGSGGSLLASGTGAATPVATGGVLEGFIPEYTVTVSGLGVVLGPGTYYLDVAPVIPPGSPFGQSFITTTSGAGAVGMPPGDDGNSYFDSAALGNAFTPTSSDSVLGPGTWDFSMGVIGTSATAVPEPASLTLGVVGGLLLAGRALRRRRRRPA